MLDFYYSTMQGGKSTALLQRRHNLLSIGKQVLVLTSALDDRYGVGKVTSRMGPQCDAELFHKILSLTVRRCLTALMNYSSMSVSF